MLLWGIFGTLFINQICVWVSSHWKVGNKDMDGVVAGAFLFYILASLGIVNLFHTMTERRFRLNQFNSPNSTSDN